MAKGNLRSIGPIQEYYRYTAQTSEKLRQLHRSSKQWWRVFAHFTDKSAVSSGVAALKDGEEWVLEPRKKATLLERTFASKCILPRSEANEYSAVGYGHFTEGFRRIRIRDVLRLLKELRPDSATGPDHIATCVLKICASVLALPLGLLARRILETQR